MGEKMEIVIKFAFVGIAIALLINLLKGMQSQITPILVIISSVIMLSAILSMASGALKSISSLFKMSQLEDESIKNILKIIGAAYITEFSATLCKDIGEISIASKIEFAGRIYILLMAVPWVSMLIEAVKALGG